MTQARKRRSNTRHRNTEPRVPAWIWLFTGCVLGAFIMFLVRLSELPPRSSDTAPVASTQQQKPARDTKPATPRFDFYDILKETKVSVPEHPNDKDSANKQNPDKEPQEYILQVASFKHVDDAEQLKVELLLLNLDAQVEQARIRNGETWHRVLVGPFDSRSKREKARSTLVANRYDALVLKRTANSSN